VTSVLTITRENVHSYLDSILEIEKASFISPWSAGAFVQEAGNPISHLWAALGDDRKMEGYICFWLFDREIQLIDIAVRPERRRRGVGEHLLREMIRIGTSRGMEHVWLEVRTSNLGARRLYEKLGFVAVGRRPRYYRDTDEDAIVMSLNLPSDEPFREETQKASDAGQKFERPH
jgi:[ribosomal protein S18]-alanine N-acetyltransferase